MVQASIDHDRCVQTQHLPNSKLALIADNREQNAKRKLEKKTAREWDAEKKDRTERPLSDRGRGGRGRGEGRGRGRGRGAYMSP